MTDVVIAKAPDQDEELCAIAATLAIAHADALTDRMLELAVDAERIVGPAGIDAWLAQHANYPELRRAEPQTPPEPPGAVGPRRSGPGGGAGATGNAEREGGGGGGERDQSRPKGSAACCWGGPNPRG